MEQDRPTRADAVSGASRAYGDLGLVAVGVLAVSTSGPIIAATAAPALAIAFWRTAFGALATAPLALTGGRLRELAHLTRRERRLIAVAGLLLAAHFATWVPSLDLTSVASSTALVCLQPVWVALLARARGQPVPGRAWTGMAAALAGVLLLTGVDFTVSARALGGDLLALVGGVFAAGYTTVGAQVRRTVSTTAYTAGCYGTCALVLHGTCLVGGQQIVGYDAETWLKLLALTAGAQLLGHSLFNRVIGRIGATTVSMAILLEVPGAAVIAALWLGQTPPLEAIPAAALLLTGIAMVLGARGRTAAAPVD
jgi:drug/metabolite transporter (DMT)-like permease